ncbi:hypothetical protein [Thiolapillus brandeum]|uniref:General secretion pathway protein N n=1 Tax=Thiolapillus brandeum TaxID=1076588 RepID=A0A7U6GGX3_9GAMM|nr:hypothetical protein [Thiolapillus brandeum]BAO43427.1 general secretion pathway protein N [Thiolapillus brandeum]
MNRFLFMMAMLLAVFIGWRWFNPVAAPKPEPLPAPGVSGGDVGALLKNMDRVTGFPPLAAYHAISARPLFFSKRRPPPPYVAEKGGGRKPGPSRKTGKPRVQLSGVISVGNQTYALLKGGKNKGTRRVRVGEDIDGWTVISIEKDKLVLRNGTETESLLLWNYKPVKPVKQAPKKAVKRTARPPVKNTNGQTARQRPVPTGKP